MQQMKNITRAKTSAHCVCSDGDKARRPFVGRYGYSKLISQV